MLQDPERFEYLTQTKKELCARLKSNSITRTRSEYWGGRGVLSLGGHTLYYKPGSTHPVTSVSPKLFQFLVDVAKFAHPGVENRVNSHGIITIHVNSTRVVVEHWDWHDGMGGGEVQDATKEF